MDTEIIHLFPTYTKNRDYVILTVEDWNKIVKLLDQHTKVIHDEMITASSNLPSCPKRLPNH